MIRAAMRAESSYSCCGEAGHQPMKYRGLAVRAGVVPVGIAPAVERALVLAKTTCWPLQLRPFACVSMLLDSVPREVTSARPPQSQRLNAFGRALMFVSAVARFVLLTVETTPQAGVFVCVVSVVEIDGRLTTRSLT